MTRGAVAIALLLNLILVSHFLGSEVLGQLSLLILNMAIVHAVSEVYTGASLVYFIPRFSFSTLYQRGLLWILICVVILCSVFYFTSPQIQNLWPHLLVLTFISAIHNFHTFLLLGKENIKGYNVIVFFQPIASVLTLCGCLFLFQIRDIHASLYALYVSFGGSVLISSWFIFRLTYVNAAKQSPAWSEVLQRGFVNQVANLAHLLSNRYNYYILAGLGLGVLGVYSSGTSLIESVWTVSAALSPLVLSKVANSVDAEAEAKMTWRLAKLSFVLSLLAMIVILFIPGSLFSQVLGKDFSQVKHIMILLSPGVLALSFSSVLSHYYGGLGQQRVLLSANIAGLIITLVFSYFLISVWGLAGACVTASLAYFMQCLMLTRTFMKGQGISMKDLFSF
jgi:O-antigen/teichoic acid export membrane protein